MLILVVCLTSRDSKVQKDRKESLKGDQVLFSGKMVERNGNKSWGRNTKGKKSLSKKRKVEDRSEKKEEVI